MFKLQVGFFSLHGGRVRRNDWPDGGRRANTIIKAGRELFVVHAESSRRGTFKRRLTLVLSVYILSTASQRPLFINLLLHRRLIEILLGRLFIRLVHTRRRCLLVG